jgi:uncharacterized protein YbjT (DUF2867 family)
MRRILCAGERIDYHFQQGTPQKSRSQSTRGGFLILVTGATGTNGRELVHNLLARGRQVRALVRDPVKSRNLLGDAVDLVQGNLSDAASLASALRGCDRAFLLTATSPNRLIQEKNFLAAAKDAGVGHLVRLSILGSDPTSPSRLIQAHGRADELLRESGIPYTLLRPNYFMQNLFWYADDIRLRGEFNTSFPRAGRHCHIDARDIAAVAATVLTTGGHEGRAYHLTGPEALTFGDMAETLSRMLGRTVLYDDTAEKYAKRLASWGLNAEEIIELDACVARGIGEGETPTTSVADITGKLPARFEKFVDDHRNRFIAD